MLWLLLIILSIPFSRVLNIDIAIVNLNIVDFLIIAASFVIGGNVILTGRLQLDRDPLLYLSAFSFMLAILASSLTAESPMLTMRFAMSIALKFLLLYIVIQSVRSLRDIQLVIGAFLLSAVVIASVGIVDSYLSLTQSAQLTSASGLFNARNEMVFYLVPAFILAFSVNFLEERSLAHRLALPAATIIIVAILLSRGRAGLLVILVTTFLFYAFIARHQYRATRRLLLGTVILGSGLLVAYIAIGPDFQELRYRYVDSILAEAQDGYGSIFIRFLVLEAIFRSILENPWLGIGAGNFKLFSESAIDLAAFGYDQIQPHNSYLGILVELGLLGLIPYLFLLLLGLRGFRVIPNFSRNERAHVSGVLFAYLSVLAFTAAFDASDRYNLWFFLGLAIAVFNIGRHRHHKAKVNPND